MKRLWRYRFTCTLAVSSILLLLNMLLPNFLQDGLTGCMLISFFMALILAKLTDINEHMKKNQL